MTGKLRLLLIIGLLCFGNGCVAYQIRDELRITNQRLAQINDQLTQMQKSIAEVDSSVAQSNSKLEKSNRSLGVMEGSMDPIRVSLRRIDDELAGFQQTINKIDRYLPINIKPDTPPPARQAPTHEVTPQK